MQKFEVGNPVRLVASHNGAAHGTKGVIRQINTGVARDLYPYIVDWEGFEGPTGWFMTLDEIEHAPDPIPHCPSPADVPDHADPAVMSRMDEDSEGIEPEEAGAIILARMEEGATQALQHQANVQAAVEAGVIRKVSKDPVTESGSILAEALDITQGARNVTHGAKERSFKAIAGLWNAYLAARKEGPEAPLTARNVSDLMQLLKIGRSVQGTPHRDHYVDAAGYAALSGELAKLEEDF